MRCDARSTPATDPAPPTTHHATRIGNKAHFSNVHLPILSETHRSTLTDQNSQVPEEREPGVFYTGSVRGAEEQ